MATKISDDTVRQVYERETGIHVARRQEGEYNVGRDHCLYSEEDEWVVGRRWSTYSHHDGMWDGGVEEIDDENGGGRFKEFETALRVAMSLEFEERLSRAYSSLGEVQQEMADKLRVFVHGSISTDGRVGTYCPDCIPPDVAKNMGEQWVDTWLEESGGWMSAPVCDVCHKSISVYIDGVEGV